MPESPFPHLALVAVRHGPARLRGFGEPDPRIAANKANRSAHVQHLASGFSNLGHRFRILSASRAEQGLPPIEGGIPFMLEVAEGDEPLLDFLEEKLGLEIVAEFTDGFLLVASQDVDMA